MLKILVHHRPVEISFHHTSDTEPKGTECFIYVRDRLAAMAYSLCSKSDVFNKEKGRKISLSRALDKLNIPKETRKIIWDAYFKQRGITYGKR